MKLATAFLLASLSTAAAEAGEVRLMPEGKDFTVSVAVKTSPFDPERKLAEGPDGNFSYAFDASSFADSAYLERIFVVTWTPVVADKPAKGVQPFSMELPILLRAWRSDQVYVLKMPTFDAINGETLERLEQLSNPGDLWRKFFASMQQSDHYAHRIRPTSPQAKRALRTAVNGFVAIAGGVNDRWLRAPSGLPDKIRQVFELDERGRESLLAAVDQADALLWQELMRVEELMEPSLPQATACKSATGAFDYLDTRYRDNTPAYERLFGKGNTLLTNIRTRFLAKICGGAVAAG